MSRQPHYSTREYCRDPVGLAPQMNPEQAYLEMKFSDDSSVFSGLVDQENEMNKINQMRPPVEMQKPKGILRDPSHAGPKYVVVAKEPREENELYSHSGSSLTDRSSRSVMREMRPMVDAEFNSGASTFSSDSLSRRDATSSNDGDTQTTWAEANEMKRPKGSVKLVSSVQIFGESTSHDERNMDFQQYIRKSGSSGSESRIVELLDDFERQMDANIRSLSEDDDVDEDNVLTDFNKNIVSANNDVESQEPQLGQFLTPHKSKQLQKILDKARQEVEVLRDHNEQYKYEIESMEEEHRSEIKLVEDRAKHKLVELKNMYQNEIDNIVQEKDAAVIEAGRVAAKYAENGKKQVSTLQKQIDKLKAAAAITIREKVKEERELATSNRDKEIAERIEMIKKSHETELETLRGESEERLKLEVEKAASSVAKRVRLNQDVLISELTTQIDDFRKQRHSIIEVLESVKNKFTEKYPEQMIEFNGKSCNSSERTTGSFEKSETGDRGIESNLMEVIEIFSFLLEGAEKKVALATEKSEFEENNLKRMKLVEIEHRDEIDMLKREIKEKDEKLNKIEEDFKALSQEKCLLREKFQKESESQKIELERISAQKETIFSIERSRKDLEDAMAEGRRELEHATGRTEGEKFTASSHSFLALPSIETPIGASRMENNLLVDERSSSDLEQSPLTIESSSIEKARKFQRRHPNRFSRFALRDSPRYRLSGNFNTKPTRKSIESANQIQINIIDNPETSDARSVISNCSFQSNGTLSSLRNQVRKADEEVIDIVNTMSETSRSGISTDKSTRSKDTILSNFRNQSNDSKNNDCVEVDEIEHTGKRKDASDFPQQTPHVLKGETESAPRSKKLAVLRRNAQRSKEESKSLQVMEQENKEKKENTDVLHRARMFKQFMEQNRQTDDTSFRSGRSLDESISSLQTNNGATNKDMNILDPRHIVQNISHEASTSRERGKNTLGMFAHGKKQKQCENDVEHESMMSTLVSEEGSSDNTQKRLQRSLHSANDRGEKIETFEYGEKEPLREGPTLVNFKKPPISLDSSSKSKDLSGKKDNVPTDVISGKKADLSPPVSYRPKHATRSDSIGSEAENSIPSSIAVRPPANKNITAVANGHTLLCKPLSVHQSKIYPQEIVSNLSGGTISSNDEDGLVYESQAHMRKLPPLTDDSDEESGVAEEDKYQSVVSKSTSVDSFARNEQKSVTFVDAKKSTIRRSGLAAFRPKSHEASSTINTSDNHSTAGSSSSDATTTITGHTRKSLSFLRTPTILRSPKRGKPNATKHNYSSHRTNVNGSKRFAALKARVRVRKI